MVKSVSCEPFFDGGSWEAQHPDQWTCVRDMNVKNFPYVFKSPRGAQLCVGTFRNAGVISGCQFEDVPKEYEQYRSAYLTILLDARDYRRQTLRKLGVAALRRVLGQEPIITKHEAGVLVGFTYERDEENSRVLIGEFCAEPWGLRAHFCAPRDQFEEESTIAFSILESFRFHMPNPSIKTEASDKAAGAGYVKR